MQKSGYYTRKVKRTNKVIQLLIDLFIYWLILLIIYLLVL